MADHCVSSQNSSLTVGNFFTSGQFPSAWKDALVIPVFKKTNRHLSGNYRPISLLSPVSKVLEKIVNAKLSKFLSPWLSDFQSGFKRGDGTTLQLTRIVQQWSEAVDEFHYVGVVFFDLKKAFDRVWHKGLLAKLHRAGVRDTALKWFASFLSGRRQAVTVDDIAAVCHSPCWCAPRSHPEPTSIHSIHERYPVPKSKISKPVR